MTNLFCICPVCLLGVRSNTSAGAVYFLVVYHSGKRRLVEKRKHKKVIRTDNPGIPCSSKWSRRMNGSMEGLGNLNATVARQKDALPLHWQQEFGTSASLKSASKPSLAPYQQPSALDTVPIFLTNQPPPQLEEYFCVLKLLESMDLYKLKHLS